MLRRSMQIARLCAILAASGGAVLAAPSDNTGAPNLEALTAVCRYVESIPPASVEDYTIRSGVFDVNGDGSAETVVGTYEGTMHVEVADIRDVEGETAEVSPTYGRTTGRLGSVGCSTAAAPTSSISRKGAHGS